MSTNLQFALLRGLWAIQPEVAHRWFPVIANWVNTGNFQGLNLPKEPSASILSFFAEDGQPVKRGEDGRADIVPGTVAVIENIGEMIKYGGLCTYGADEITGQINAVLAHPNVVGLVFRTDSPGGQVSSIAPYIDAFSRTKKPIVTLADTCASAAYFAAASTNFIMAENNISAAFGSIGVVVSFADFSKAYEAEGITLHEVYADQSTHKNKAFHDALKGDYAALKTDLLNPLAAKFISHVKANRPKLNIEVEGILGGRMFFAEQALEHGLIDGIGSLQDAIAKVQQLSTIKSFLSNV